MKKELLENAVNKSAGEVMMWWENAAGDMGYYFDENFGVEEAEKQFKKYLKTCPNREIAKEAMADWFHSDVNSIVDCCGDHIFDEASSIKSNPAGFAKEMYHDEIFILICETVKEKCYNSSMKLAMDRMIADHKMRLKNVKKRDAWFGRVKELTGMDFHDLDARHLDPYKYYREGKSPEEFVRKETLTTV